jgi:4-amino-4-deoxy-L-arabinose transferase-like glycosyltransferase
VKLIRPGPGAIIFLVGLTLRVAWVLLRWSKQGAAFEFPDEDLHWQLASNLVSDGTLVSDDGRFAARLPAYPLFLALFAWAGESGILIARLAQAALGAATAWIAYSFVHRAFDRRAAIVAGVLVCIDPYAVFFANLLLTEVLFGFFAVGLTACAWLLVTQRTRPNGFAAVGVAVLGAAALMTRPSAAGWIALLWAALWLFEKQRKRATRRLTLQVVVLAVCLIGWGLRNRAVIGAPAWLSTNGGVTLYDAQGPQADGSSDQTFLSELPELAALDEVQRDRKLRQLAIAEMREDPGRVWALAWTKFRRTWSLIPNVADYRGGFTGLVSAAFTAAVLLGALVGLARTLWPKAVRLEETIDPNRDRERAAGLNRDRERAANGPRAGAGGSDSAAAAGMLWTRQRRRLHMLLWLPMVYFTLVHCVFIGSLRYRVPLMPFLEIAAATAFAQIHSPGKRSALEGAKPEE